MTEGDHYVANMEYQLLWKTRDEKIKRSATDGAFLIIFGLLTVLWIGIGIHGFTNGDGIPIEATIQMEKWMTQNRIMEALSYSKGACFGFIWFAVLLIALFFIMVRWVTKFTIFATLVVVGLSCVSISYSFLMTRAFLIFMFALIQWLILGVTIYALKKVGTKTVCKVLQDACKTMICFPSSLLIVLLELAIRLGVVAFTIGATVYLLFIKITTVRVQEDEFNEYSYLRPFEIKQYRQEVTVNPPTYVKILLPIFIGISLWIIPFVGTFRSMLLHGMFSHWYRASDKKNISSTVGLRCFATTSRYHMGTVAFASTIFAIIPVIGALFNSVNSLVKLIRKRPSSLCALWLALFQSLSNASIMCISYGTSLCQSTKDGLQLVMHNPLKYIAVHVISVWIMIYGFVTILLIAIGASYLYFVNQIIESNNLEQIQSFVLAPLIIVIISSNILAAMLIMIFKNAVEAVTICFFEESNLSKTGLEDSDYEV